MVSTFKHGQTPLSIDTGNKSNPIRYLRVSGTRHQMGSQHGEALRVQIQNMARQSRDQLRHQIGKLDKELDYRIQGMVPYVKRFFPELIEEVRGIAAGAAIDFFDAMLLQCRFELIYAPGHVEGGECTLVGVTAERSEHGTCIIAQNVDLSPFNLDYAVLLHMVPDCGPEVLTTTFSGILAQEGINSTGLGLCGSMVVPKGHRVGLPNRNFLRRAVLEQCSVEDALALIARTLPRATGHNLMLSDISERLVDVEQTTVTHQVLKPDATGIIAHSNHYVADSLLEQEGLTGPTGSAVGAVERLDGSRERRQRMLELLDGVRGPIDVEHIKGFLRDHSGKVQSICRHAETDSCKVDSVISLVSLPSQRTMQVAFGPPCDQEYRTFQL